MNVSHSSDVSSAGAPSGAVARSVGRSFQIFRYYSITSLVGVVLAALAIGYFFRVVAIREIENFGEYANTTLAEMSLQALRADALKFLAQTNEMRREQLPSIGNVPVDLEHELEELRDVKSVVRMRIYNKHGWVIYSSEPNFKPGTDGSGEPGVRVALGGRANSTLVYHDFFTFFSPTTPRDNLIQTHFPISSGPNEPVRGVFEIFVDVRSRVADVEQSQWQIAAAALLIMGALYLSLLAFVRYAAGIIERQQAQIQAHANTLEVLSARMLAQQEDEKKRLAFDLHEGIAQTLSAVKMNVDATCRLLTQHNAAANAVALEPMAQTLKEAIGEVRALALKLRPSSLDDLGLHAAMEWFCGQLREQHPGLEIRTELRLPNEDIPEPLRVILFRVLEETLKVFVAQPGVRHIEVTLDREEDSIELAMHQDGAGDLSVAGLNPAHLDGARERTVLSGGRFAVLPRHGGGCSVRTAWLA